MVRKIHEKDKILGGEFENPVRKIHFCFGSYYWNNKMGANLPIHPKLRKAEVRFLERDYDSLIHTLETITLSGEIKYQQDLL